MKMQYKGIAKFLWLYLGRAGCRFLSNKYDKKYIEIKKKVKDEYISILNRTEDIPKGNNQFNLCFCVMILSFYKALNFISKDDLSEISRLMFRYSTLMDFMKKRVSVFKIVTKIEPHSSNYENDWANEIIDDYMPKEFRIIYRACGIKTILEKEGAIELLPIFCATDYISFSNTDIDLLRTKTQYKSDICEFRFINKKISSIEEVMMEENISPNDLI